MSDVLGALASQHELPGGGGPAAALTAAAAAALTAKVARGARTTWIEAGGAIAHAESLRMQAQALIERDAQAYRRASSALLQGERSARRGVAAPAAVAPAPASADRERMADEALIRAADLSLAIADAASQIAQLAAQVARHCPRSMRPDPRGPSTRARQARRRRGPLPGRPGMPKQTRSTLERKETT